jgi:hypothetical protein
MLTNEGQPTWLALFASQESGATKTSEWKTSLSHGAMFNRSTTEKGDRIEHN